MSGLFVVFRIRAVVAVIRFVVAVAGTMVFVKLLGAVGALEFMAFTGNTGEGEGGEEQGESFHRGAS